MIDAKTARQRQLQNVANYENIGRRVDEFLKQIEVKILEAVENRFCTINFTIGPKGHTDSKIFVSLEEKLGSLGYETKLETVQEFTVSGEGKSKTAPGYWANMDAIRISWLNAVVDAVQESESYPF